VSADNVVSDVANNAARATTRLQVHKSLTCAQEYSLNIACTFFSTSTFTEPDSGPNIGLIGALLCCAVSGGGQQLHRQRTKRYHKNESDYINHCLHEPSVCKSGGKFLFHKKAQQAQLMQNEHGMHSLLLLPLL